MRTRRVGDASPRSMAASAAAANSGVTPDQNTTIDTIAMMARKPYDRRSPSEARRSRTARRLRLLPGAVAALGSHTGRKRGGLRDGLLRPREHPTPGNSRRAMDESPMAPAFVVA